MNKTKSLSLLITGREDIQKKGKGFNLIPEEQKKIWNNMCTKIRALFASADADLHYRSCPRCFSELCFI